MTIENIDIKYVNNHKNCFVVLSCPPVKNATNSVSSKKLCSTANTVNNLEGSMI